jgi:glycosyltransferase 2 family protein
MIYWYRYIVYLSLCFLAVALYDAQCIVLPRILSFAALTGSFLFLFAGFISTAVSWKQILERSDCRVDFNACVAGVGLSTFGKYIPGKIWMVVGKAAYLAKKNGYSLGRLSIISLSEQFITLWLGLTCGTIGLFLLGGVHLWGWLIFCLWLGLTAAIFNQPLRGPAERLMRKVWRKEINLPSLTVKSTVFLMPWFVVPWVLWSIGFYLLVVSLTANTIPWSVGLGFPLSATLGIMALIAPGGLGVREGIMVVYLTLANIPVVEATTIAIASRSWFLMGELFIFIVGWVTDRRLTHFQLQAASSLRGGTCQS